MKDEEKIIQFIPLEIYESKYDWQFKGSAMWAILIDDQYERLLGDIRKIIKEELAQLKEEK